MENISENKRKRGRPLKELHPGYGTSRKDFVKSLDKIGLYSDLKSERGKINASYMADAQGALSDENGNHPLDNEFSFIIAGDRSKCIQYKKTILQELGRLEDPETIREAARIICEQKMSTTNAIRFLRRCRCEPKKGSVLELEIKIERLIVDYCKDHPDITDRDVLNVLESQFDSFSENISENKPD
jgi:hypothetical protein